MGGKKDKFINREVSWLHFNDRVLQEAADRSNPLIERLKFLGIYSSNLDEFFRVRVATVNRMIDYGEKTYDYVGFSPKSVLKEIHKIDEELQGKFNAIYEEIMQELSRGKIFFVNELRLTPSEGEYVREYFRENVRTDLFPVLLDSIQDTSFLKDRSIYLAVLLSAADGSIKDETALVKVPVHPLSRFVILPEQEAGKRIMMLDDVIRYCLPEVFTVFDHDRFSAYTVKFTRDAELDLDNDISKSFMRQISEGLKQRSAGHMLRFVYDREMPDSLLQKLIKKLQITKRDSVIPGGRYHNFKDLIDFPDLGAPHLVYSGMPPLMHPRLAAVKNPFTAIREKDIMLHFPYHSFQHVVDLLRTASIDPKVRSIRITLYRLARNSKVVNALINAARNGKMVTVFVELQARFDEEANIQYTGQMQEAGVKIITGIPGFKVHGKLLLIRRKDEGKSRYYSYIATGNFNEQTARVYADSCLLTTDADIARDVRKIFDILKTQFQSARFKRLILSPFSQRNFFIKMINNESANARAGKRAEIIIKLNNLVDEKIVRKLYLAGKSGVKIRLIIRGICILVPENPEVSEKIECISILDRFLEHTRILYFYNGGDERIFISSADWMKRNFDTRIEVTCPVRDPDLKAELKKMLEFQLADNTKARIISSDGRNEYVKSADGGKIRSQQEFYEYLKGRQ